jgi:hypothetical protein
MEIEHLLNVIPVLMNILSKSRKSITLDCSEVRETTAGTSIVMWAQIEKANKLHDNIEISLMPSRNSRVMNLLMFPKERNGRSVKHIIKALPQMPSGSNRDEQIDMTYIDRTVAELKKILGIQYYEPFYDFLVELIGNATEHGIRNRNINWWMWRHREDKSMRYVFVDMGIGIIGSYEKSQRVDRYRQRNKQQMLLDALNGKLGSSTKERNRGR